MEKKRDCTYQVEPVSKLRKIYILRFIGRIVAFILSVLVFIFKPEYLNVIHGFNFFREFSPLHILWVLWMIDMLQQLIPIRGNVSLGSQKLFRQHFKPIREKINPKALREYIVSTTKSAYLVFILWALCLAILGGVYYTGFLKDEHLFLITALFYVMDLFCVLIWCPFRLNMKNRCCTTCRIFNWDHMMMFTPMLFVCGFYSISLLVMSGVVFLAWELCVLLHPERFWFKTNEALRCSECTDKLCTQYCRKLR